MVFRVQGKNIFLTYAQAERIESKEHLLWALRDKIPTPTRWVIGQEQHQDGGKHFHVMLGYDDKVDIRDQAFYDYNDHHPNVQCARAPNQVLAYCTKEDREPLMHGYVGREQEDDIYDVIQEEIANGTHATEVIRNIISRTKTKGLRLYNQISNYVDRMMRPNAVHVAMKEYPRDFPHVDEVLEHKVLDFMLSTQFNELGRDGRKSLWLYGASRMGKTVLARSLGNHWYMNGAWNVECYDDRAEYGVLDDISWESMQRYYKGIMGLQLDVTVTDKYKKKSVIRGGKPVIILTNELPVFSVAEAAWLEANVVFHYVDHKLYE